MISQVAIVKCADYEENTVLNAVRRGLGLLGGVAQFSDPHETLLLKPNMLAGEPPEKAVTTHPSVFRAVAEVFRENRSRLIFGDSPALGSTLKAARKSGLKSVADELDVPLADFKTGININHPDFRVLRNLTLARSVVEADGVINICKMKSHALTKITGSVKNCFGCVPGFLKEELHLKMKQLDLFCSMLVDVAAAVKPRLHIMDGILAMDGNGPRSGRPFPMNVLLFSTDPVALDSVFCRLVNFDPLEVPYLIAGHESGLGTCNLSEIHLRGDDLEMLIQPDFKINRQPIRRLLMAQNLPGPIRNRIVSRPVMNRLLCSNCGSCVKQCPVPGKAVNWIPGKKREKPRYDYSRCIRCYCCQEVCPEGAISVKTPLIGKIIFR